MIYTKTELLNDVACKKAQLEAFLYMVIKTTGENKKFWYDAALQLTDEISKFIIQNNLDENCDETFIWEEAREKAFKK